MRRLIHPVLLTSILLSGHSLFAADSEQPARHQPPPPNPVNQAVKHTILKAAGRFQRCYLEYLKGGATVRAGELTVDWQITPKGTPVKAEVVSSSFSSSSTKPALEPCIVKQVAALEFPPTGKPENHYTFHKFRFKDVQQGASAVPEHPESPTPAQSDTIEHQGHPTRGGSQ